MQIVSLSIPAAPGYLDIARLSLYGVAAGMGFSYEDIEDMKVAVSEACNNAVLHAYAELPQGKIDIRFEIGDTALSIRVKDRGRGFQWAADASGGPSPLEGKRLKDVEAGGLGIYLMEALMDDVQVRDEEGTEVILTKFLKEDVRRE